jgi:hypothetical protein
MWYSYIAGTLLGVSVKRANNFANDVVIGFYHSQEKQEPILPDGCLFLFQMITGMTDIW